MVWEIRFVFATVVALTVPTLTTAAESGRYTPDWDSLDRRPLPAWYDEAKFGVFMHWGLYAVPSYTEWFWWDWEGERDPDVLRFVQRNYRPGFQYADFGPQFTAEFFDPQVFAQIIKSSGAKYFVLTSKHHEGYTMYPSNYSWNWNSVDVGPHRDIVGELSKSIREAGIKFGLYYSLYEWFNPMYLNDKAQTFASKEYVQAKVAPQLREIINNYRPEVIWSDGDWEASWQYWNSTNFLAWLYNDSPVKDTVVTNDRWGSGTLCKHGDFFTCSDKYNPGHLLTHKWENCMTIDRNSWGFRRVARFEDYLSAAQLIAALAETISCGGNLLLNVGPTHDGRIAPIFEERLGQLGRFVALNDRAIFGTRPWIYQNDTLTPDVWYTSALRDPADRSTKFLFNHQKSADTVVYAFVLKWPSNGLLRLGAAKPTPKTTASLLGYQGAPLRPGLDPATGGLRVDLSAVRWSDLPEGARDAWVFQLEFLATEHRKPQIFAPKIVRDTGRRGKIVNQ